MGQDDPRLLQIRSNKAPKSSKMAQRCRKMVLWHMRLLPSSQKSHRGWLEVSPCRPPGNNYCRAVTISERRKRVNLRSFDLAQSTMNVVRFAFGLPLLRFCVARASLLLCFCFAFAFAFVLLFCCLCFPNGGAPLSYIPIFP